MVNRITNYRRIQNWENFFLDSAIPALGRMQEHAYREQLAAVLRQMGGCCDEILYLYDKE